MPHDVIMPALGMAQDTGKVVAWLKAPGDRIAAGEPLFEVETDKATMEVEAERGGWLAAVHAEAGAEVAVGSVIAVVSAAEPDAPVVAAAPPLAASAPLSPAPSPAPAPVAAPEPAASEGVRVLASPKAKRLARERGIDIAPLFARSGGRPIHVADLDAAAGAAAAAQATETVATQIAAQRIEARVDGASFQTFLGWLAADAGAVAPGAGAVLAAFAAGAWREAMAAERIAVRLEAPGRPHALHADPDLGLGKDEPGETAALVVRDLTASRLTALALAPAEAPVFTVAPDGDALAVTFHFHAQQLDDPTALALVDGFAARLEEPLRQLL
ncbi:MAG: hypothetical protein AcusKO_06690 [Acuticoccus sp.]